MGMWRAPQGLSPQAQQEWWMEAGRELERRVRRHRCQELLRLILEPTTSPEPGARRSLT